MIYVFITFFLGADNSAEFGVKSNVENKKSFDVGFFMLFRYLYVVLSNKRPQLFSDYLIKSFSCLESPYKVVATLVESKSFMKYCT